MNWYKIASAEQLCVMCYGCNHNVTISSNDFLKKKSDPANWRCEGCQKQRLADKPWHDETKRDRSVAQEFNYRMESNNRMGR